MSLWTHLYGLAIPFFTRWRVWLRAARTVVCDNELTVTKPSRSENAVSLYYFITLASLAFFFPLFQLSSPFIPFPCFMLLLFPSMPFHINPAIEIWSGRALPALRDGLATKHILVLRRGSAHHYYPTAFISSGHAIATGQICWSYSIWLEIQS